MLDAPLLGPSSHFSPSPETFVNWTGVPSLLHPPQKAYFKYRSPHSSCIPRFSDCPCHLIEETQLLIRVRFGCVAEEKIKTNVPGFYSLDFNLLRVLIFFIKVTIIYEKKG